MQKRDVIAFLDQYAVNIKWKKNNRIMDVGCGDGGNTSILTNYVPTDFKLVGCDISTNMVKFANDNYSNERTSFAVLDIAGCLPDSMKGKFDQVFSFYALHWVLDQRRAFENIYNLLDQDGKCFMMILCNNPVFDVYRILSRTSKWCTWVYDVQNYISPYHDSEKPEREITTLMESIGYTDINVQCKDSNFSYPDIDIARKHFAALNPFKIPKDKNNDFMDDYIEVLKELENRHKLNTKNFLNGITLYYKLLFVFGRKPSSSEHCSKY
ncbi:unnamed protein product [Arctia plantaginis]|uniref:Methyltransferase type 11 domain-containing protein n=1 Tax=Arctia plantaginis TaxID=874455 RepID=A0A8S1AL10_ARCPL|nr:unnamed protein product [Arctia plantaginis]CAB3247486.1 unnamed protein product [Arctia plantaginis]